jgi:hypothetical protein
MFFNRKPKMETLSPEDELELLSGRLETSMYHEDKVDSLGLILDMSKEHPVLVGTHVMQPVIRSAGEMDEVSMHISILRSILGSVYGREFVDMLLVDLQSLDILCGCIRKSKCAEDVYELLCSLSCSELFTTQILKIPSVAHCCTLMARQGKTRLLQILADGGPDFKKQLIFEGVFENIVDAFREKPSDELLIALAQLLKNCSFGQDYFIELDWTLILSYKKALVYRVLIELVDLKNTQIRRLQSSIYRAIGLTRPYKHGQWCLLYKMICGNPEYTGEFVDTILVLDNMLSHCSPLSNPAVVLLEYILSYRLLKVPDVGSFQVYSILSVKDPDFDRNTKLKSAYECIIAHGGASDQCLFHTMVFILFSLDASFPEPVSLCLIEVFNDYTRPLPVRNLCLLALLILEVDAEKVPLNAHGVVECLRGLRIFLSSIDHSSTFFLTDGQTNILIENICSLVDRYIHRKISAADKGSRGSCDEKNDESKDSRRKDYGEVYHL